MGFNRSDPCESDIIFLNGKIAEQTSKIACMNYGELLDVPIFNKFFTKLYVSCNNIYDV